MLLVQAMIHQCESLPGDHHPLSAALLLKVEHLQSSTTGCGVGCAQQALTEALDGGKVGSKPKRALHHPAAAPQLPSQHREGNA